MILEVIQYTDPYCTWCWGSEPVMRHIEAVFGDQVSFGFVLGGLVPDVSKFSDPLNNIGGPDFARQVAAHWEEASKRHGMPVDASVWLDMKDEFKSTWPASVAFKAAEMQDTVEGGASGDETPGRERSHRYMRRLREAAAAEHRFIHRREVQEELALEVGLDLERFRRDLDSGAAEAAFHQDLDECYNKHVTGFPSFQITSRSGEEIMFFGFQPFPKFVELFERLAGRELEKHEVKGGDDNIVEFIRRQGKVAWREVSEVFSMPKSSVIELLSRLEAEDRITTQKAGNGWFYLSN